MEWQVPSGVYQVEVFAVGGGGAGKMSTTVNKMGNNGGSGGQVIYQTVTVNPGQIIQVTVGAGGVGQIFIPLLVLRWVNRVIPEDILLSETL